MIKKTTDSGKFCADEFCRNTQPERQLVWRSRKKFAPQLQKTGKSRITKTLYVVFFGRICTFLFVFPPPPILMVSIRMQQGCINGHHHGTAQSLNQNDIVHRPWIQKQPKIGQQKQFKNLHKKQSDILKFCIWSEKFLTCILNLKGSNRSSNSWTPQQGNSWLAT